jgi:hypothetical protein
MLWCTRYAEAAAATLTCPNVLRLPLHNGSLHEADHNSCGSSTLTSQA